MQADLYNGRFLWLLLLSFLLLWNYFSWAEQNQFKTIVRWSLFHTEDAA